MSECVHGRVFGFTVEYGGGFTVDVPGELSDTVEYGGGLTMLPWMDPSLEYTGGAVGEIGELDGTVYTFTVISIE